ncbi:MAG: MBL fold metallo-hydrolase [Proteobacteria bacterium]|nr:MBL fold metallo-hydrolase [Pseudomonadota bacterium]
MGKEGPTGGPQRITPHVWRLGFPDYPYFLIQGQDRGVLAEGGVSGAAPRAISDLALVPGGPDVRQGIVLHTHADHVTGFLSLRESDPGFSLAGTAESSRVLANGKIVSRLADQDRMYNQLLLEDGRIASVPALPTQARPLDVLVTDGETWDLGDATITFLETPGHAPGGLALWVEPDRCLLISDAAGYAERPDRLYPLFFQDFTAYQETLERLAARSPEHLACGHNLVVSGAGACREFLAFALSAARAMGREGAERLEAGEPPAEAARDWALRLAAFGFFSRFPQDLLLSFSRLLLCRALGRDLDFKG